MYGRVPLTMARWIALGGINGTGRQVEVQKHWRAVRRQQDVGWLQVAVEQSWRVGMVEPSASRATIKLRPDRAGLRRNSRDGWCWSGWLGSAGPTVVVPVLTSRE
jgi:hypothetical protein